jgi:Transcription factor WhiB
MSEAIARELFGETEFTIRPEPWTRDAACLEHPELSWFPRQGAPSAPAKQVCRECLVQCECLAYALEQEPGLPGVWGATSPKERRDLVKSGKVTAGSSVRARLPAVRGVRASQSRRRRGKRSSLSPTVPRGALPAEVRHRPCSIKWAM